jgi:hypothetical protein
LDLLLNAFVSEVTQVDIKSEVDTDDFKNKPTPKDDDWDEMCHFLTQKKVSERTTSSVSSEEVNDSVFRDN